MAESVRHYNPVSSRVPKASRQRGIYLEMGEREAALPTRRGRQFKARGPAEKTRKSPCQRRTRHHGQAQEWREKRVIPFL